MAYGSDGGAVSAVGGARCALRRTAHSQLLAERLGLGTWLELTRPPPACYPSTTTPITPALQPPTHYPSITTHYPSITTHYHPLPPITHPLPPITYHPLPPITKKTTKPKPSTTTHYPSTTTHYPGITTQITPALPPITTHGWVVGGNGW
jgi:hypothetical protein